MCVFSANLFYLQQQQISEFMTPLKPAGIRIGKNESGNRTGWILIDGENVFSCNPMYLMGCLYTVS